MEIAPLEKRELLGVGKPVMALVVLTILILGAAGFLAHSQVNNRITEEDGLYIRKILEAGKVQSIGQRASFQQEIAFIGAVQKAILSAVKKGECLPKGRPREPKDVYLAKCGESYDRSRVIEKALRSANFQTRHIMMILLPPGRTKIRSLFSTSVDSHSVTEVKTVKGWLVVDPDDAWLSLSRGEEPISLKRIQREVHRGQNSSGQVGILTMPVFYREPFIFVYGLYSRHGKFYPPYNFLPDINWREFFYNLTPSL